ncbi:hypothetical protein FZC79_22505 [Rossellomorea vietnamensis]|uniref:Uncharacterized protein n=1 Tax=Rossellomorea vietnamensis TaxID=218284 RepID=A0A5D4K6Y2_9BACI|nr:hypothetical protein FZC79_22505 [Rossellomorea vietnamensis]
MTSFCLRYVLTLRFWVHKREGNWLGVLSTIFIVFCLYFTLTFLQNLKTGDKRIIKQSKIAAVVCLALGLLIPAFYNL